MSEPITAWRYWRIGHELEEQGDNLYSYVWHLRGDFEIWDGPLMKAGTHKVDPLERFYFRYLDNVHGTESDPDDPRISDHSSPRSGCLCGVNAVKRLRSADLQERSGDGPARIFGVSTPRQAVAFAQVDLGGRVDEYEEGYRAEYARIAGPIYVVNPPSNRYWQEQIERKYGQPVIVQRYSEAINWIRKDEQAHGHRQAHQDARTGTAGITSAGSLYFSQAARQGYVTHHISSVPPLSIGGARPTAIIADDAGTRPGGRTRARLKRALDIIADNAVPYTIGYVVGSLSTWLVLL